MSSGHENVGRRHWGPIPEVVLGLGVLATAVSAGVLAWAREWGDPPWMAIELLGIGLAALVRHRRPTLPAASWFALMAGLGPVNELLGILAQISAREESTLTLAWVSLAGAVGDALAGVAAVLLIGLFPEGRARTRVERLLVGSVLALLPLPLLVGFGAEHVHNEWYLDIATTDNPLAVLPFRLSDSVAGTLGLLPTLLWLAAFSTLGLRYRRSPRDVRRNIRWLLLPLILMPIGVATELMIGTEATGRLVIWLLWMTVMLVIMVSVTLGLLGSRGLDVDTVLRRTMVYGALWLAITGTYVGVATLVGTTAGRYVPVPWAVAIALVAALLFQPARQRLERLADRWVFGHRTDPAKTISTLGTTLAETFELETLLPRMTSTVESGLDLEWAEVRLDAQDAPDAEVSVPVVLDGEQLGVVACGPKRTGAWSEDDRTVVETFARQAALAVRNVRLTEHLTATASEISASRVRLVKAQESERRRIERNIHDGVQQDLVALIGLAGRITTTGGSALNGHERDLRLLTDGLTRVLDDLRDLARGIHPSLLSDKGLLAAVESLAARHPVPVDLRADPELRDVRFSDEAEAACYFTVAEALANTLKHARARRVSVELAQDGEAVRITVTDDGIGFLPEKDPSMLNGHGLNGMRDRLEALQGSVMVDSRPGCGTTVSASISMDASLAAS